MNDHVRPCNLKPQQRDLTPVLRRPVEPASRHRTSNHYWTNVRNKRHFHWLISQLHISALPPPVPPPNVPERISSQHPFLTGRQLPRSPQMIWPEACGFAGAASVLARSA